MPFGLIQRITTNMPDITAGVAALTLHSGADGPESNMEALYQAATGDGFRSSGGATWTAMFNPMMGFDASLGHGMIGGAGYRMDALPIIIMATDNTFHRRWDDVSTTSDRATWCGNTMGDSCNPYSMGSFGSAADQQPKSRTATLMALQSIGAVVMGISSDNGAVTGTSAAADGRAEMASFAVRTGAWVPPTGGNCKHRRERRDAALGDVGSGRLRPAPDAAAVPARLLGDRHRDGPRVVDRERDHQPHLGGAVQHPSHGAARRRGHHRGRDEPSSSAASRSATTPRRARRLRPSRTASRRGPRRPSPPTAPSTRS